VTSEEYKQAVNKKPKHTALIRPALGNFGRNEWAILGAPCGDIKFLAQQLILALDNIKIGYIDAQHTDEPNAALVYPDAEVVFTDKADQKQFSFKQSFNHFQYRALFNSCDMLLLNGNHHQAQRQVVIIDSRKKASLHKRISQLTDVRLFLLADGETEPFDFIKKVIPNWQQIPIYRLEGTEQIIRFFNQAMEQVRTPLNALVLAGGKSERMGQDKGAIHWHPKEQRYYMTDLLKNYTNEVYISCRTDQCEEIDPAYPVLTDTFTGLGPLGAILSAFREQPEKAWLVVACDLPLLDSDTLGFLVANRDASAIATTFQSPHNGFPEPLITIWEPKSYPVLLSFLAQGYSCPRKVLINSDTRILQAPRPAALMNVNTPEEAEKAKALLQKTSPPDEFIAL
jgi:molybdopterin-guanine dinucleotide biosynthesis protein A